MLDNGYKNNTLKKNKHLLNQFFEYAIDNNWITQNPTVKIKLQNRDRNIYNDEENYKALPLEIRNKFLNALNEDEANFIKPLCITLMFAGLRIGEALALKWKNFDTANKTLKVERAITQIPKFDNNGNVTSRVTVVGDTKTTCSVREIPITEIVVDTLCQWKEKQFLKQQTDKEVTANLTSPNSYIFANDDGSVRTYSGTRKIFDRFKKRNGLKNFGIHFHTLRHTFSNMLFELNENPKAIQQLLGHRDVKTTITVYNSVNNDYIKDSITKLNNKIQSEQPTINHTHNYTEMTDEELEQEIRQLELRRELIRRQKQKDFEM